MSSFAVFGPAIRANVLSVRPGSHLQSLCYPNLGRIRFLPQPQRDRDLFRYSLPSSATRRDSNASSRRLRLSWLR